MNSNDVLIYSSLALSVAVAAERIISHFPNLLSKIKILHIDCHCSKCISMSMDIERAASASIENLPNSTFKSDLENIDLELYNFSSNLPRIKIV